MKTNERNIKALLVMLVSFISFHSFSQSPTDTLPLDPGSLSIYTVQNLQFGAFAHNGSGGTISISTSGVRSVAGSVQLLNLGVFSCQAIFEFESEQGSVFSLMNGPNVTLAGSNGGSVILTIGSSYPTSPFMTTAAPPAKTAVHIGGKLTVGDATASPPGNYTGNFYLTFNQE
ncbi:MAG: hypothetical protein JWQ96_128 [Segetibacter sp.]|nr:hypothetical protein [Segetibacter sp.]